MPLSKPSFSPHGHPLMALLLFASFCALLTSCVGPPATIKNIVFDPIRGEKQEARLYRFLARAVNDPEGDDIERVTGSIIEMWKDRNLGSEETLHSPEPGGTSYHISFTQPTLGCYLPQYFDELDAASNLTISKLPHYRKAGAGAPLVALRENRHSQEIEKFYPPEAITRPLTAVISPGPKRGNIQEIGISLLCPLSFPTVTIAGKEQPLAADYSAPWAAYLSRTKDLNGRNFLDTLTRKPKRAPQLYLMEPYNANKKPLLMIHGLFSTPLIWAKLSNEMWADDQIRENYQVWHYLYNTSAPPLYSARILRTQLRELQDQLDPDKQDFAWKNLTILAHSMGGIVTKSLTTRPKDSFWEAAFTLPQEELKLSPKDRIALKEAFEWEPIPHVQRIIFVAVPHRGSDFADSLIGRIGRSLVKTPNAFHQFYSKIYQDNPTAFTPQYLALGQGRSNSISVLSPQQPTLKILSKLPYAYPIKKHSIIGDRDLPGPLAESSDGIVPYWSSHLEDVLSEKVIPSDHGAFEHPEGVAEILRILRLN